MLNISFIPALRDNYIWCLQHGTHAFVVDPGDAAPVIEHFRDNGLTLSGILITHHHADHQGGIPALCHQGNPPVFAPAIESITGTTHPLYGGECLDVLGFPVQVLPVPGHTRGHVAYLAGQDLFCGDTLFGAGCGRLFEGTPEEMLDSLERIARLPDETRIFCAHEYTEMNLGFALAVEPGNPAIRRRLDKVRRLRCAGLSSVPSTLAEEKATNPFLRCDQPEVVASVAGNFTVDREKTAIFAALRAWRNDYRQ